MSRGLNKVMLIGRLGANPEIRYTPDGNPVATFTIATNESYTSKSGERVLKQNGTEWLYLENLQKLWENIIQKVKKSMLKEN